MKLTKHLIGRVTLLIMVATSVSLAPNVLWGQANEGKRKLEHKDYDIWKTLGGQTISNDGKWVGFSAVPGKGSPVLTIREVDSQKTFVIQGGGSLQFSFDSLFAVYSIRPDAELLKKLRREKKKPEEMPQPKIEILNLKTGKHTTIEKVSSFTMPQKAAGWLAYSVSKPKNSETVKTTNSTIHERYEVVSGTELKTAGNKKSTAKKEPAKKEKKKATGSTLVLRNLATGIERRFPNVSSRSFSKFGKRLAFCVSSEIADEDGVYVIELADGSLKQIISGRGNYRTPVFNEKENLVVFTTDRDDFNSEKPHVSIYLWEDWNKTAVKIVDSKTEGMPKGWWIASGSATFTEDSRRILLSTQPKPDDAGKTKEQLDKEKKAKANEEPKATLDLWHWQDPLLQPQQLLQAARERNRSYRAVYDVKSKKFIQLATKKLTTVIVDPRSKSDFAVGYDQEKYFKMRSWESPAYADTYLVDLKTGKARLVLGRVRGNGSLSPSGRYMTWWDADKQKYFCLDTTDANAKPVDLTRGISAPLANELHDTPSKPRSYGAGGWFDGEEALLLYTRYDVWKVDPTGSAAAKSLTQGKGRSTKTRYRVVQLDREKRTLNPNEALTLSVFNEATKASGYARLSVDDATITNHLVLDERVGGLRKAKDADTVIFTRQTFRKSPDVWASTMDFKTIARLSHVNPQQKNYTWGTAELVHYQSADGKPLSGILMKPDGFDPKKKYPMMVYFYERNSDNLHAYSTPAAGRSIICFSFYVSRGYVLFIPDIPYTKGYPGKSAYNAIIPGINQIVKQGFIDEKKIGVQGHSWGGYQIAYLVTQTDIFACAESGAPVSNMTSAYGGIRWSSGMSRMFQYERTQSRIGETLWQARDLYLENSPVFFADKVNTPLLILHNDKDGAVPWYQGIEMFVALRRLNKPAWMLNYNGEPHWVMKPENRIDFATRMQQFFDHYLQDAPAPKWLVEGIPAVDKGKEFGLEPAKAQPKNESEPATKK